MRKETTIGMITVIAAVLLLIVNKSMVPETEEIKNELPNTVDKTKPQVVNIIGEYKVKEDKNSRLILFEDGEYEIHINACDTYLEIKGKYEKVEHRLKLINEETFPSYPTLDQNQEFSFTILDENTIRLEEDLACLYQNTLFER